MLDTTHDRPERIGGASGILALILSIGGFGLIGAAGFAVEPGASTRDIVAAVADGNASLALAGLYVDTLGSLLFIVFAACLWGRLRRAEGDPGWLSLSAFAAALAMIAAGLGDKAAFYAIFSRADSALDAGAATALYDLTVGFFTLFHALAGLFLVLAGVVAVRTGAFRSWLGWAGVIVGLVMILSAAAPDGSAGQLAFPLFVLWIVAVSIALLRVRPAVGTQPNRRPAPSPPGA